MVRVFLRSLELIVAGTVGAIFASMIAVAWTGPSAAPPANNAAAPINVGTVDQVKNGGLSVNALAVFGNAIVSGTSRYLNFGTNAGATGYGIRDNAGTMEFKSNGSSWQSLPTAVQAAETDPQVGTLASGQWCSSDGTRINCTNTAPLNGFTQTTYASGSCGQYEYSCQGTVISCPPSYTRIACENGAPTGNGCSKSTGVTTYVFCMR